MERILAEVGRCSNRRVIEWNYKLSSIDVCILGEKENIKQIQEETRVESGKIPRGT